MMAHEDPRWPRASTWLACGDGNPNAVGLLAVVLVGGRLTPFPSPWLVLPGVLVGIVLGRWSRRTARR